MLVLRFGTKSGTGLNNFLLKNQVFYPKQIKDTLQFLNEIDKNKMRKKKLFKIYSKQC